MKNLIPFVIFIAACNLSDEQPNHITPHQDVQNDIRSEFDMRISDSAHLSDSSPDMIEDASADLVLINCNHEDECPVGFCNDEKVCEVQCFVDKDCVGFGAANGTVCDQRPGSKGRCATLHHANSQLACAECVSDSECKTDYFCIQTIAEANYKEYRCLPRTASVKNCISPLPHADTRISLGETKVLVCMPAERSSCSAIENFGDECTINETCGMNGFCYRPTNTVTGYCSYECNEDAECAKKMPCRGVAELRKSICVKP